MGMLLSSCPWFAGLQSRTARSALAPKRYECPCLYRRHVRGCLTQNTALKPLT